MLKNANFGLRGGKQYHSSSFIISSPLLSLYTLDTNMPTPQGPLGWWLLGVAGLSFFGSYQGFFSPTMIRDKQFSQTPAEVTDLARQLFGAWTLVASIVRLHCAFHINEPGLYRCTLWTFIVALGFYGHQYLVVKSIPFAHLWPSLTVASISLLWMTISYRANIIAPHAGGRRKTN